MVKADFSRDYYADLELPPTADPEAIKKQFRKLALKYHPDRNPGRETEVNSKFQTIQSAHEILTNAEQKSRYDAHRARMRYTTPGTSSSVVGNPWQNAGSHFPPPPKRPQNMNRKPTGAERYAHFAKDVPPASARAPKNDTSAFYKAWEEMKPKVGTKSGSGGGANSSTAKDAAGRKGPRPQTVPRTASQRVRAEASFARKSGFAPNSPLGDEPPVTSKNYSNNRSRREPAPEFMSSPRVNRSRASSDADPLGNLRDSFMDPRQSTPYQTHGGEKLNPFEGVPLGRPRSARTPARATHHTDTEASPAPDHRHRSSSVPDVAEQMARAKSHFRSQEESKPQESWAGERYKPKSDGVNSRGPFTVPNSSSSSLNGDRATNGGQSTAAKGGPPLYASRNLFRSSSATAGLGSSNQQPTNPPGATSEYPRAKSSANPSVPKPMHSNCHAGMADGDRSGDRKSSLNLSPEMADLLASISSSEDHSGGLNPFESKLRTVLDGLAACHSPESTSKQASTMKSGKSVPHSQPTKYANSTDWTQCDSFSFQFEDDTFTPDPHRPFTRNSAENINTRFVAEEFNNENWQFNAGGSGTEAGNRQKARSKSSSRLGRRSPDKNGLPKQASFTDPPSSEEEAKKPTGFNAEEWSQKIGPQIFVPPQTQSASASPTRSTRPKKAQPVRKTMGSAGMVFSDDGSSGTDDAAKASGPAANVGAIPNSTKGTESPVAMDIDPPQDEPLPKPQSAPARNISVEPARQDWRFGVTNNIKIEPKSDTGSQPGPAVSSGQTVGGSEDSEDFKTSFADWRNVEPFAPTGLNSFADIKSSLPFESQASARVVSKKTKRKPIKLSLPEPPKAPNPPPTLAIPGMKPTPGAWQKFVDAFRNYMREWHDYSNRFVEHFQARVSEVQRMKAANDFAWLDARDDSGINEYLSWQEQDRTVREKWSAACDEHEKHVREFSAYRDRMLK